MKRLSIQETGKVVELYVDENPDVLVRRDDRGHYRCFEDDRLVGVSELVPERLANRYGVYCDVYTRVDPEDPDEPDYEHPEALLEEYTAWGDGAVPVAQAPTLDEVIALLEGLEA